jgi:hypothetical protein
MMQMSKAAGLLTLLGTMSAGCSDDAPSGNGSSGVVSRPAPTKDDAGGTETPPAGPAADCTSGDEGAPVPSSAAALQTWLQDRAYQCWARESTVHASTGPHGGNVRVFLNASLQASLTSGAAEHPAGAVAVKELYGSGKETVTGWAVGVKTQAASSGGQGWYWYEVFDTAPNASGALEGQNKSLCTNCHASGRDFVLITHPLR